jgi:hypothetical protein
MPKAKADHVHKYQRFLTGKNDYMIFRCMEVGCSHFMPTKELIIGRQSRCWGSSVDKDFGDCQNLITIDMTFTDPRLSGAKLYCEDCKQLRKMKKEAARQWAHLSQERA